MGGCLYADEVTIESFTDICLHEVDAFNCYLSNSKLTGVKATTRLVVVEAVNSFPNMNHFYKSVLLAGKIAVQCLGSADVLLEKCAIEDVTILLNTEKTGSVVEPVVKFRDCWLESISSPAIVNAKINTDLSLITPVINKGNIGLISFQNNWVANVAAPVLDAIVNPNYENITHTYNLNSGPTLIVSSGTLTKKIIYTSANNPNESPLAQHEISTTFNLRSILSAAEVSGNILTNPLTLLVGVQALMAAGNSCYANFISIIQNTSELMPFSQLGTTYDSQNFGMDYKIKVERLSDFILTISAKGMNAYALTYVITLLRPTS